MYHNCHGAGSARNFHGFHKAFEGGFFPPFMKGAGFKRPKYNVPLNIEETETEFIASVYAVGFGKEDIKLSVNDDTLYIIGQKNEVADKAFSRQEFPIKNFERTLFLNGQVDIAQISAKSENGILIVTLPKSEEALHRTRDIEVQ